MYHKKIIFRLKLLGGLSDWNKKALGKDREKNGARIWDSRSIFGLGTADIQDCNKRVKKTQKKINKIPIATLLQSKKYSEFYCENVLVCSLHKDKDKSKTSAKNYTGVGAEERNCWREEFTLKST